MTRKTLYEYCLEQGREQLLAEWDTENNGTLSAHEIAGGSHARIWWKCEKGHRWQAPVYSRTVNQAGCPYCTHRKPLPEAPTLAENYPELAAQWHPSLNKTLTPEDVTPQSHREIWWSCPDGHEWKAQVKSRVSGSGCPYCANRKVMAGENDLGTTHPHLAAQWHPERNGILTPQEVLAGSRRKVWWKCAQGHEWLASLRSRSQGTGCPVCSGKQVAAGENDLASAFPDIAAQWHPDRNGTLTPAHVTPYSNRSVWWICALGHEYKAAISSRTNTRTSCPYCAGRKVLIGFNDLATREPLLCTQWEQEQNGFLTPQMVTVGSHKKVWWRCPDGHVWKAVIASRTGAKRHGCPFCAGRK